VVVVVDLDLMLVLRVLVRVVRVRHPGMIVFVLMLRAKVIEAAGPVVVAVRHVEVVVCMHHLFVIVHRPFIPFVVR
jgi:hypothetical protein